MDKVEVPILSVTNFVTEGQGSKGGTDPSELSTKKGANPFDQFAKKEVDLELVPEKEVDPFTKAAP